MRKIALLAVILGSFTFPVSGNTIEMVEEENQECLQREWDYGTEHGRGNSYAEWFWTNDYIERNC